MKLRVLGWLAVAAMGLPAIAALWAATSQNDFRFSIIGDRTGDPVPGVYEAVWRDIAALHPDFVIAAGDTIQGGNDATAESEWKKVRTVWERFHRPFYLTSGNHDIWSPASRTIYQQQTGHAASYGFNYQNAHFTVLDNSETENLSAEQMAFLERDLAANRDRDPKFVLFHKPFWLLPVRFHSSEFQFHRLLKNYGAGYVISGHGHQFVRLTQDGVLYLEAASAGGKLKGQGFAKCWFFGQIFTEVKAGKVEMTVKEIDRPLGEGHKFNAEQWGENGPKFDPTAKPK